MAEPTREEIQEPAREAEETRIKWRNKTVEASNDAVEYLKLALDNGDDKQYKMMMVNRYAAYLGITEWLMNEAADIRKDMTKTLRKKGGASKDVASMLADIYIARLLENLHKELTENGIG